VVFAQRLDEVLECPQRGQHGRGDDLGAGRMTGWPSFSRAVWDAFLLLLECSSLGLAEGVSWHR
jgi:hypothetical protein